MEISQEHIEDYSMWIRFTKEELKQMALDALYIKGNVELGTPMFLLLTAVIQRDLEVGRRV